MLSCSDDSSKGISGTSFRRFDCYPMDFDIVFCDEMLNLETAHGSSFVLKLTETSKIVWHCKRPRGRNRFGFKNALKLIWTWCCLAPRYGQTSAFQSDEFVEDVYLLGWFPQQHWWFSGRILACHAGGPGSIPGQCMVSLFFQCKGEYVDQAFLKQRWNCFNDLK